MSVPGHSSYLVGQGTWYLVKAYEFLKETCGEIHEEWLSFAKKVAKRVEKEKNGEQEYPYIFSEYTGVGLEYDSFGGVWCMAAVLEYMKAAGQYEFLKGVKKSETHYYTRYVKRLQCYGGPLDISKGIDSEGILAYMRAVRCLHEITGEKIYLEHLKDAIEYEFMFKFCYSSPVKVPPLSKTGWSSCGGSVTSVVNPHIHPMSSSVIDEMLYYVKNTGDTYIQKRIDDVILWGCQTYNHFDKEYDYGKRGWMSERYCYSQGLLTETYPDGTESSTWFALMPWASASVLEGMTGEYWKVKEKR